MAKFCTKCGKKLDGEVLCSCTTREEGTSTIVGNYINQYLEAARGIFSYPVDTMKKFGKSNHYTLGMLMVGIDCLVSLLFLYLFFREFNDFGMRDFNVFSEMGRHSFFHNENTFLSIGSLMKILIVLVGGFFGMAITLTIMIGSVYKKKVEMKQMISLIGVCSIFMTLSKLIALLCLYISMEIMGVVLIVSSLLYFVYLYHGILVTTEIEENKVGYAYVSAVVVFLFLVAYLLPKILF